MKSAALRTHLLQTDWVVPLHNDNLHQNILILGKRAAPIAKVRVRR
jgi:thiamine kinase-like enzyme